MTPYQKIKRAAINRTSLHLSADEVWGLYFGDDAIKTVADNDDGWEGFPGSGAYVEQRRAAQDQPNERD